MKQNSKYRLWVKGDMTQDGANQAGLILARGIALSAIMVGIAAIIAAIGTVL